MFENKDEYVIGMIILLVGAGTVANFPLASATGIIEGESTEFEISIQAENGIANVKIKQDGVESEFELDKTKPSQVFGKINEIIGIDINDIESEWSFETKDEVEQLEVHIEVGNDGVVKIEINNAGDSMNFEFDSNTWNKVRNEIKNRISQNLQTIDFPWKLEMKFTLGPENPDEEESNDNPKVTLCHLPPGNPANAQTLIVSESAIEAHLAHGDFLGECSGNDDEVADKIKEKRKEKDTKTTEFKKKQKELKKEIKKLGKLKQNLQGNTDDLKATVKELKSEIKKLLKGLKDNHNYDLELKKELKHDIKIIKNKVEREEIKHKKTINQKIDSKLSLLSKSSTPKQDAKKLGLDFKNGKTRIVLKTSNLNDDSIETLQSLGKITSKSEKQIQMIVDVDNISKIRTIDGIEKIRPPFSAIQFDEQISEGVYFINADLVQYAGITGNGVKVAVFDLAFTDNEKISDNIVEVKSFRNGLGYTPIQGFQSEAEHGTAVAEIITDVAPDVQLYLYAMETDIEFGLAVDEAISKGADIIAMSAGWPHFPTDGTSHITKKIEEAIDNDITFVVPAGNFGNKHWEGSYNDSNVNGWHEFSTSDEGLSFNVTSARISEEKPIVAYLMWDTGLGDVADFELVLVDPLGQIVDYSANPQKTKSDTPFEYIHHIPDTEGVYALGVVYAGETLSPADIPEAKLEIFTPSDELEHAVSIGSVSVPADAEGAIVVGAVNHLSGQLEPFSSQGPTNNGKLAPHLVGPDGVTTVALDGHPFYGTSATTPYIAGMAALLLETNPDISPQELLSEIQQNTGPNFISLHNEYDNGLGYGKADASFLMEEQEDRS